MTSRLMCALSAWSARTVLDSGQVNYDFAWRRTARGFPEHGWLSRRTCWKKLLKAYDEMSATAHGCGMDPTNEEHPTAAQELCRDGI